MACRQAGSGETAHLRDDPAAGAVTWGGRRHCTFFHDVLHALSNSTPRKVPEHLSFGPASVGELAAPFAMKLASLVPHLSVLEQSRRVTSKKRGRARLVWTSMLFPDSRPAVVDDIPITALVSMESVGTGTRCVSTALHRDEADCEQNKASVFYQGAEIPVDQFVELVIAMT